MNVRGGNTIFRTLKLPKNYSNLPIHVCIVCKIHVPLQNAHSKKNARTNLKQIQTIPTKFEVKVSQGTQTASEIQTKSPFHQFKLVFFFFEKVQLPLIHLRRHTLIRHTPFSLPLSNAHGVCQCHIITLQPFWMNGEDGSDYGSLLRWTYQDVPSN